ncbi:MAG: amino acid decarboxylase [Flavobacteriales bacterium]|jgi:glutamate/tyrosine decarboxylase-like PLP-dependent enzyme|nr:amino acid decarboxylase [Flavobacteriales bacterium]
MDKELESIVQQLMESDRKGRALDLPAPERMELLREVEGYTNDFLDSLEERKAYEAAGYDPTEEDRGFDVGEAGSGMDGILDFIGRRVDHTGLNPASGGHLGYIPGGGIPASAMGDYLAAITNRYAGNFYASPGAVRMENSMIQWTGKLVGYPDGFGGNLTSGGSIANLIAIATARSVKRLKGKDLEKNVVYLSEQTHHSLPKALRLTGLGECIIRHIALDSGYRMDPVALRRQVESDLQVNLRPFLLIANAGSTDVGAVDPLGPLAEVAEDHGLWFHVDAAYGGYFLLTNHGKEVLAGIERSDSVVLDPHKGLFLPYGSGILLVKDIRHLLQANSYEANYMQDTKEQTLEYSPAELSPELSKHFRGMRLWLPLKLHGIAPFRACLEEKLWLARYFRHQVKSLGFEVGPEPDLSVVVYRFVPATGDADAFNKKLAHAIQQDGRIFISTTLLNGMFMLRFAVLSFRTHRKEADVLLEQLRALVRNQ